MEWDVQYAAPELEELWELDLDPEGAANTLEARARARAMREVERNIILKCFWRRLVWF